MSTCAHRIYRPYRYQPAPIRAGFVPCPRNLHLHRRREQRTSTNQCAFGALRDGTAPMTDLISTSCQPVMIQIPIALQSTPTTVKYPAVSSLEACPTPAH
jgi:hypothetical protein